jgi:excisionase family DNA binding protein
VLEALLTIEEVAACLRLKRQTIYRWVQTGVLPAAKFGKEWRIRRADLEMWIDSRIPASSARSGGSAPTDANTGSAGLGVDEVVPVDGVLDVSESSLVSKPSPRPGAEERKPTSSGRSRKNRASDESAVAPRVRAKPSRPRRSTNLRPSVTESADVGLRIDRPDALPGGDGALSSGAVSSGAVSSGASSSPASSTPEISGADPESDSGSTKN